MALSKDIELQRKYYEATSSRFDEWHLGSEGDVEHLLACQLITAFLEARDPQASVLDVGGGTGRFYRYLRDRHPQSRLQLLAIEPSAAQRAAAYAAGVPRDRHVEGDATRLQYGDDSFDYCTAFGVLHHIKDNTLAVREICRVAAKGVFLSDCNRYGQGHRLLRMIKRIMRWTGAWPLAEYIRTRGKSYHYSERDGISYSFSIFDQLDVVRAKFPNIYVWPTRPVTSPNLILGAPQVLLVALR